MAYIYPGQSPTGIYPGGGIQSPTGLRPDPFAANPQVNLPVTVRRRLTARQIAKRKALRAANVPRHLWPTGLGDEQTDAIVKNIMDAARQVAPEGTAEFETWVNQKLKTYGLSYAKYQAERAAAPFVNLFQNPWIVVGLAVGALWLFRR